MTCLNCGGLVEWKGPLTDLTHTECLQCGAVNNQEPDDDSSVGDDCIQCDNSGRLMPDDDQCEWCYREPNSKFNKQNPGDQVREASPESDCSEKL